MATCYHCGDSIEFIHNGFQVIPIHASGSCGGRSGGFSGFRVYSSFRSTDAGEVFEFPFVTYPSYVNPNAHCPVCGAEVFFYQSPYGGRVFFDELGPPWPKHPCTDNPVVSRCFSTPEGRASFLISNKPSNDVEEDEGDAVADGAANSVISECRKYGWVESGWMPFIVKEIAPRTVGLDVEGTLYASAALEPIPFRISQTSVHVNYYRKQGHVHIGFSFLQNANLILSVLNECPVFLKKSPDFKQLRLSSFFLTREGEVEEVTLMVEGVGI